MIHRSIKKTIIFILFFHCGSLSCLADEIPASIYARYREIIACVQKNDARQLSNFIAYPLKREYLIPDIKNSAEFIAWYPKMFDAPFRKKLAGYSDKIVFEHNGAYGLVGGAFNGDIWLYESGKIASINYLSAEESRLKETMTAKIKSGMHPSVRDWTKNILISKYNIPAEKITVVHNGIDVDDCKALPSRIEGLKKAGNKIVLFVGRITMQKGPDYFVRSAVEVLKFRPNTIFIVSGSGDMERQMMREAADFGIADKMLFAGFLRGDELNSLYQSADLYVMPSISEPFGITPLESLANGTPVLISKQSGVSEVLSHALKADFWDINDMADKIVSTLDNSSLHETLRENGNREVARQTWALASEKCLTLYKKLCLVPG